MMAGYTVRPTPGDTAWFRHDRFGMFIHFGLYAMPARHEWIKTYEKMTDAQYDRYFHHFNPDRFDPHEWARRAKAAGMKYAVLTAKHHEGFCLFDSKYTDYKSTNTPIGRDLVREYCDAFRAEGIRVGLYYSLIDWHHPDFTIDPIHPRCDDPDAEEQNKSRDMRRYAKYMRDQVEELLTNYGRIDILWFDFSYSKDRNRWMRGKGREDWESEKLIALARRLQPHVIIDNRCEIDQDIWTPEQFQPTDWIRHKETGERVTWEACQTFSGSWGYHRDESTWKTPEMLIEMLVQTVACGGNLIMNVGPTSRGHLDERAENALGVFEKWMKYSSRSIYGCTMAEEELLSGLPANCCYTQSEDGRRLYVHLLSYPFRYLRLGGLADKIEYAQFLHDGSEILYTCGNLSRGSFAEFDTGAENSVILHIPALRPPVTIPVIEIFLITVDPT